MRPSGLTFAAKPSPSSSLSARLAGQKRKKTLFDDPGSDNEDAAPSTSSISTLGGLSQSKPKSSNRTSSPPPKKSPKLSPATSTAAPNLSSQHTSRRHAQESTTLDPTIYDYDAFYETSKTSSSTKNKNKDADSDRSSRYITSLLASKRTRDRDALRAEEKKLAREREAEGDEFADKEKFVTVAYKAQREERRRAEAEEEERERREEEERRRNGGGMKGFYKGVLAKEEERRKEIEEKEREVRERIGKGEKIEDIVGKDKEQRGKSDAEKAHDLNARGGNVVLNDEGAVVDKRQLLSAGLNVAPEKPSKASPPPASSVLSNPHLSARYSGPSATRRQQIDRQTAQIEAQILARQKEEEEREAQEAKEREEKLKSKKTTGEVMGARERYLARKREREEEPKRQKLEKEGGGG